MPFPITCYTWHTIEHSVVRCRKNHLTNHLAMKKTPIQTNSIGFLRKFLSHSQPQKCGVRKIMRHNPMYSCLNWCNKDLKQKYPKLKVHMEDAPPPRMPVAFPNVMSSSRLHPRRGDLHPIVHIDPDKLL